MSTQPENELSTQKPAEEAEWKLSREDALERLHELAEWAEKSAKGSMRPLMLTRLIEAYIAAEPAAPTPPVASPIEAREFLKKEFFGDKGEGIDFEGTVSLRWSDVFNWMSAYYAACREKEK